MVSRIPKGFNRLYSFAKKTGISKKWNNRNIVAGASKTLKSLPQIPNTILNKMRSIQTDSRAQNNRVKAFNSRNVHTLDKSNIAAREKYIPSKKYLRDDKSLNIESRRFRGKHEEPASKKQRKKSMKMKETKEVEKTDSNAAYSKALAGFTIISLLIALDDWYEGVKSTDQDFQLKISELKEIKDLLEDSELKKEDKIKLQQLNKDLLAQIDELAKRKEEFGKNLIKNIMNTMISTSAELIALSIASPLVAFLTPALITSCFSESLNFAFSENKEGYDYKQAGNRAIRKVLADYATRNLYKVAGVMKRFISKKEKVTHEMVQMELADHIQEATTKYLEENKYYQMDGKGVLQDTQNMAVDINQLLIKARDSINSHTRDVDIKLISSKINDQMMDRLL